MLVRYKILLASLVLSCGLPLYPCSIVTLGVWKPEIAREIAGTVIGWDRKSFWVIENDRPKPPKMAPLEGATVLVTTRKDLKFFQESDITQEWQKALQNDLKQFIGWVTQYECGTEAAKTTTDAAGAFRIPNLKQGRYCLKITRARAAEDILVGPHTYTFLVDIAESGTDATLLANISELMPDCTGGESLKLKPAPSPRVARRGTGPNIGSW